VLLKATTNDILRCFFVRSFSGGVSAVNFDSLHRQFVYNPSIWALDDHDAALVASSQA